EAPEHGHRCADAKPGQATALHAEGRPPDRAGEEEGADAGPEPADRNPTPVERGEERERPQRGCVEGDSRRAPCRLPSQPRLRDGHPEAGDPGDETAAADLERPRT